MDDAGEEREARAMTMEMNPPPDAPARQAAYTGILPFQAIRDMVQNGEIKSAEILKSIEADQIQPASIDLRLGDFAYPVDTSFLPGRGTKLHSCRLCVSPAK